MKLNVGCGNHYAPGWTNTDITKEDGGPQPDVVCSVLDLPFEDDSVDRIYAGHVLEHLSLDDVPKALAEFRRVLAEDGELMLVGPDLTRAEKYFPEEVEPIRYGAGRWAGDVHLWESREDTMAEILADNGWDVKIYADITHVPNRWPVTSRIGWQFAMKAIPV